MVGTTDTPRDSLVDCQFSYPLSFRVRDYEAHQFSDVVSTMKALRLPIHASPVTYLLRFRGPRDSSLLRAR